MAVYPALCAILIASNVSETEPIWFNLIKMEFPQPRLIPFARRSVLVTKRSSPTMLYFVPPAPAVSFCHPSQSSSSSASSMEMIRIFLHKLFPMSNQLLRSIYGSGLWQFVLALLSGLPLGRSGIHCNLKVLPRLISGFLYRLKNGLDCFLIRFQCRCKTTLIPNGCGKSSVL